MSRHNTAEAVWTWTPTKCESCGEQFSRAWEQDHSLSGELVWQCDQCKAWNYPPIPDVEDATPVKPISARARHARHV